MGLGVKVALLVVFAVVSTLAARRMARAGREPISDDECVSCGSTALEVRGPGTYVCRACGYEGGSGQAAQRQRDLASRYAELSPDVRAQKVVDHVRTAARILSNYESRSASSLIAGVALDLDKFSGDEGYEASTASVASDLSHAAAELRMALAVAGGPIILPNGSPVDAEALAQSLLNSQDRLIASITQHGRAGEAFAHLQSALAGLEPSG